MGSSSEAFYVVDRLEGELAILVADDGTTVEVTRTRLPREAREGSVLRVPLSQAAPPDWSKGVLDEAEQQRRLSEARARLEDLRKRDPGGNITL